MNNLKKYFDFAFFGALALFFIVVYSHYWLTDPVLQRDDILLIRPLDQIRSFGEYLQFAMNNTVLDVQPLRDLTLWINLKFQHMLGYPFFHAVNFLIFFVSIILFRKLLKVLEFSSQAIYLSLLIYSIHPVMVSATGWISARKHSLALVFLLLSLISFIKEKKITIPMIGWFFLSVLSHQIFILFPVWVFLYSKYKKFPQDKTKFSILAAVGFLLFALGTYKTFVMGMGNTTYETFSFFENISRFILSSGRAMSLLLFPVSISGAYDQGHPLNLLGIPLIVMTMAVFYKQKAWDSLLWILLGALAYALTYIAFVNDTYLYLPLICLLIAFNYSFRARPLKLPSVIKNFVLIFCLSLLVLKTISASKMWKSDLDLWRYSWENEGSPYSQIQLSQSLIPLDQEKGIEFLRAGARNFDLVSHREILKYFLTTIYTSNLPIEKKIEIMKECYVDHIIYNSWYGLTLAEGNDFEMREGTGMLKKVLEPEENYVEGSDGRKIYASLKYLCRNFPGKDVVCKELNITSY
ncbi:MAG: hypothetical protein V4598_12215 [Bdellovibrionota bacterium]